MPLGKILALIIPAKRDHARHCESVNPYIYTILLLVCIIVIIALLIRKVYRHARHRKDCFNDPRIVTYKAELMLFKSLEPEEQAQYINMDRDKKMRIYGARLFKQ